MKNKKIAIIGAGISGLAAANKLAQQNQVTIFEKSRGIGGRMATRRTEKYHFDHGAQFFIAKNPIFQEFCQKAEKDGIIAKWNCRFSEIIDSKINKTRKFNPEKPHYVAIPQMNNLCKYLARDLDILLKKQIKSIEFSGKKWLVKTGEGENFGDFDCLILAIPNQQALEILPQNFRYLSTLQQIKMSGCFALMLGFSQNLELDFDAALVKNSIISWISANHSKASRPKNFCLTVNSSNKFADENIEQDQEIIKQQMINALSKIINFDQNQIDHCDIHRWRYANAPLRRGEKSLFDENLQLGICGDWLISGRVENGFLSALDLVEKL